MIRLTAADAATVNEWGKRDIGQEVDFTAFLSDPMNVCLAEGDGCAMFVWRGPGIYELHIGFEQRGRAAMTVLGEMLEYMRACGGKLFWAAIPVESRKVIMFARLMGWKSQGFADLTHGRCELFIGD